MEAGAAAFKPGLHLPTEDSSPGHWTVRGSAAPGSWGQGPAGLALPEPLQPHQQATPGVAPSLLEALDTAERRRQRLIQALMPGGWGGGLATLSAQGPALVSTQPLPSPDSYPWGELTAKKQVAGGGVGDRGAAKVTLGLTDQKSREDACDSPQAGPRGPLEKVRRQQHEDDIFEQHHL